MKHSPDDVRGFGPETKPPVGAGSAAMAPTACPGCGVAFGVEVPRCGWCGDCLTECCGCDDARERVLEREWEEASARVAMAKESKR